MKRQALLTQLAALIATRQRPHPVRVAIDGSDVAGKTTLADELIAPLEALGRPVIRASIDGFHRPRADRYRRGPDSPAGYYHDSFDHEALLAHLLIPLGPGGNRQYRRRTFDYRADSPIDEPVEVAPPDAVLLLDGVFLLRPALNAHWDTRIFVDIGYAEMIRRARARDADLFGGAEAAEARYRQRYIPGQRLYLAEARPHQEADAVVHNNDPARPRLRINPESSA